MKLPLSEVDKLSDDDPTLRDDGFPSHRFYRHLYFAHFGLGEPWGDSFKIAHAFRESPLPLSAMQRIADGWDDDEPVARSGDAGGAEQ